MGKIKRWLSDLSEVSLVIVYAAIVIAVSGVATSFFGKRYQKFYPNQCSSSVAVSEFKRICGPRYSAEEDEYGKELSKFFDSRGEAVHNFMSIVHRLNNNYANGKFWHCYLGNERIYQCYDKNKNLIAVRLKRYKDGWESFYEMNLYVEK